MGKKYFDREKDVISIRDFVNNYLGINWGCENLYHRGLKEFNNPFVITISNELSRSNPELVGEGILLLVRDAKNNIATYIKPSIIYNLVKYNKEKILDQLNKFVKGKIEKISDINEFYLEHTKLILIIEEINYYEDILAYLINNNLLVRDNIEKRLICARASIEIIKKQDEYSSNDFRNLYINAQTSCPEGNRQKVKRKR